MARAYTKAPVEKKAVTPPPPPQPKPIEEQVKESIAKPKKSAARKPYFRKKVK